jgi:hypothetical protein
MLELNGKPSNVTTFSTDFSFQNTMYWNEKSVEDVVTLEPTAQATLVLMNREKIENS